MTIEIEVDSITRRYAEVKFRGHNATLESGTLDREEATELFGSLMAAAFNLRALIEDMQ